MTCSVGVKPPLNPSNLTQCLCVVVLVSASTTFLNNKVQYRYCHSAVFLLSSQFIYMLHSFDWKISVCTVCYLTTTIFTNTSALCVSLRTFVRVVILAMVIFWEDSSCKNCNSTFVWIRKKHFLMPKGSFVIASWLFFDKPNVNKVTSMNPLANLWYSWLGLGWSFILSAHLVSLLSCYNNSQLSLQLDMCCLCVKNKQTCTRRASGPTKY